jgi:hypothetical protein
MTSRAKRVQNKRLTVDENPKTLGTAINGNVFEVGNRDTAGKYESYKYEAMAVPFVGERRTKYMKPDGERCLKFRM